MRLSIPAAFLAAILVWPAGAGAQELDGRVRETAHCAGKVLVYEITRYDETENQDFLKQGFMFANRAVYLKYKEVNGRIAEDGDYSVVWDTLMEGMFLISSTYDMKRNTWPEYSYREILRCYGELSDYMLDRETVQLNEDEQFDLELRVLLMASNWAKESQK
jgi:hypothetical protein